MTRFFQPIKIKGRAEKLTSNNKNLIIRVKIQIKCQYNIDDLDTCFLIIHPTNTFWYRSQNKTFFCILDFENVFQKYNLPFLLNSKNTENFNDYISLTMGCRILKVEDWLMEIHNLLCPKKE